MTPRAWSVVGVGAILLALACGKPAAEPLLHVARAFNIPPARLLMIGDSVNDVQAARAAGCPVLVLPYGYNEGQPVQSLDADGIVPSLAVVADRVRRVANETT